MSMNLSRPAYAGKLFITHFSFKFDWPLHLWNKMLSRDFPQVSPTRASHEGGRQLECLASRRNINTAYFYSESFVFYNVFCRIFDE